MIEPTEKVGLGGGNRSEGGEFEVPPVNQNQRGGPGSLHDRLPTLILGDIPGDEREVIEGLTLILPHQLKLRPGFAPTAACAREFLGETLG